MGGLSEEEVAPAAFHSVRPAAIAASAPFERAHCRFHRRARLPAEDIVPTIHSPRPRAWRVTHRNLIGEFHATCCGAWPLIRQSAEGVPHEAPLSSRSGGHYGG